MSGRRRSPKYKRYRRFKKAYRKGGYWGIAKQAAKSVVKYYLNPEYKFLDSQQAATSLGIAGQVQALPSLIAQGDDATSRDGNSIKITSMLIRGYVTQATGSTAPVTTRFMIFTDVSSNASPPLVTDVLQTANVLSPMNRVNGSRFKILFDRNYTTDPDDLRKGIKVFKKMQHHIHYLDGSNTSTSLGQGAIYFLWVTDTGGAAVSTTWNCRMRFLDN